MKNRKNTIIVIVLGIVVLGGIIFIATNNKTKNQVSNGKNNQIINEEERKSLVELLNSIVGIKAENVEIINNPVIGVKGKVFASELSIQNGIDYFLKKTDNNKMKDIKVDIQGNIINLYVNYKVNSGINTEIEVSATPSLDENGNLVIVFNEVKIIDVKLPNFLVNLILKNFISDWFNNTNMDVKYNDGNIVISKDNFKGVTINSMDLQNDEIIIDGIIDVEKIGVR